MQIHAEHTDSLTFCNKEKRSCQITGTQGLVLAPWGSGTVSMMTPFLENTLPDKRMSLVRGGSHADSCETSSTDSSDVPAVSLVTSKSFAPVAASNQRGLDSRTEGISRGVQRESIN